MLRKKLIDNVLRMRMAVARALEHRRKEDGSLEYQVRKLQNDIKDMPYHIFGDHVNCDR